MHTLFLDALILNTLQELSVSTRPCTSAQKKLCLPMQTELCRNNQADKADEYPKYPFQRRYESILLVRRIREIRVLYKHRVSLLHIDGVPLNCQPFIMDLHSFSVTSAIAVCNNALLNCIASLVLLDVIVVISRSVS